MREVYEIKPLTIITIILSVAIIVITVIKPILAKDLNRLEFTEMHKETLAELDKNGSISKNSETIDSISNGRTIIQDYNIDREYTIVEEDADKMTIETEIKQYNDIIENNKILTNNITLVTLAMLIFNLILIVIDRSSK